MHPGVVTVQYAVLSTRSQEHCHRTTPAQANLSYCDGICHSFGLNQFSIDDDHARCSPAAQRFALLALLEKKLTRVGSSKFEAQITSVPLITN
ncbi:hypothetical protein J6590_087606, partial [Homalodisca vitripennis]